MSVPLALFVQYETGVVLTLEIVDALAQCQGTCAGLLLAPNAKDPGLRDPRSSRIAESRGAAEPGITRPVE